MQWASFSLELHILSRDAGAMEIQNAMPHDLDIIYRQIGFKITAFDTGLKNEVHAPERPLKIVLNDGLTIVCGMDQFAEQQLRQQRRLPKVVWGYYVVLTRQRHLYSWYR
ncbi:hypothetical protein [Methylomusa anaerophila]|nr:hypothetical protein [Methylomusa anaerophila]